MIDLVYKMKNTTPTVTGEDAIVMMESAFSDTSMVIFASDLLGFEPVNELAVVYSHGLGTLKLPSGESIPTLQPIHALSASKPSVTMPNVFMHMWGLVYGNGAVFYVERPGEDPDKYIYVLMSAELADELELPHEKISLESSTEGTTP